MKPRRSYRRRASGLSRSTFSFSGTPDLAASDCNAREDRRSDAAVLDVGVELDAVHLDEFRRTTDPQPNVRVAIGFRLVCKLDR
ncbi:hypothetical protein [Kribbella sp. VKM Ac-2571]|uniref:hypothetical protein n=1 Tax=Kribbella sp. VKM Ac-2571 TaxID=2512222 RepID=UPI001415156F|nr:hypothetical protein [Kribbella sp. VKM Ac-2571]